MTLEEAIQHLKESLSDPTHKWGCEECKEEHLQLLVWLESYKDISESYPGLRKKIDRLEEENMRLLGSALRIGKRCETLEVEINRLQSENDELKRLLRLAVDDFDKLANVESCYYPFCGEKCPFDCTGGCEEREWKHRDEAMKLLGGDSNAEN